MSWFYLKDQPNRKKRQGIWLRTGCLPKALTKKIHKHLPWFSIIRWVKIKDLREHNQVLLEIWSQKIWRVYRIPSTFTVLHLLVPEDPKWVCEGDLGRGLPKGK